MWQNRISSIIGRITGLRHVDSGLAYVTMGNAIAKILGGILVLLLATILVPETYGILNYYIAIASIVSAATLIGLDTTVTTYLAKKVEKTRSQANLLILFSSFIGGVIIWIMTYNTMLSLLVLAGAFFPMSLSERLGNRSYKEYMMILIGEKSLQIILALYLYFIMGINGIVLGFALAFLVFSYRYFQSFRAFRLEFDELKSKMRFAMHNYVNNLTGVISLSLDKLLIAPLFGFAMLGIYQLSVQFLLLLYLLPISLFSYLLPETASGVDRQRLMYAGMAFSVVLAFLSILISPLIIPMFFSNFVNAIQATQIISISIIPMTLSAVIASRLIGKENSKLASISSLIHIGVQIPAILTLGNIFGITGLALSMVIASSAQAFYLRINSSFK